MHATAPDAAATDWAAIVTGYDALRQLRPSPVITLNRAVALGFRDGPAAGLTALAEVASAGELAGYHLLPAVRADLLRRAGRRDEAVDAYRDGDRGDPVGRGATVLGAPGGRGAYRRSPRPSSQLIMMRNSAAAVPASKSSSPADR